MADPEIAANNTTMRIKPFWLLLLLVAVLALAGVWVLNRPKHLAVGFQTGAVNYPVMHALDDGFFARAGLLPEARLFQSANDAQDALLGGSIFMDAVIPIQSIASVEIQKPGSFGILALLLSDADHPLDFLIVPASSPIHTPANLHGKTVVVFPGTYSETVTRLALEKLGITDVKFLKLPPADMTQALQSGRADAGIVYEPLATLAEADGWGRVLERGFWEKHLLPVIVVGAYAYNGPEGRKNPALARGAYAAIAAAVADARANPTKAKQPLVKYLNVRPELLAKLPDSRVEMADQIDPNLIKQTLELYAQHGIIPRAVDLTPLLRQP